MTELNDGQQVAESKPAKKLSRRQFLKTIGASLGAYALARVPSVEASPQTPANPEWALKPGEVLGVTNDSQGISLELTLTRKGTNKLYFFSDGVRHLSSIGGEERARYFAENELVDTGDVDRVQALAEEGEGLLVMKLARKAGENVGQFRVRRAAWESGRATQPEYVEDVVVKPVHSDGEILDVLAMNPYQLAVLEKTEKSYMLMNGAPLETLVVRRLLRQKAGEWKNVSAPSADFGGKDMPFVKFFSVVRDEDNAYRHYQDVELGMENGILSVRHDEWWHSGGGNTERETYIGPRLARASSGYDDAGRLSNYPLNYDKFVAFTPNWHTGGYNLEVHDLVDNSYEPILNWGSIGIKGAEPVSARAMIYDKERRNALCPFTYRDHNNKLAFALFNLSWDELPMGETVRHHVTGKAFGFLPNGGEITGVANFREGTGRFNKETLVGLVVTKGNDSTIHTVPLDKI